MWYLCLPFNRDLNAGYVSTNVWNGFISLSSRMIPVCKDTNEQPNEHFECRKIYCWEYSNLDCLSIFNLMQFPIENLSLINLFTCIKHVIILLELKGEKGWVSCWDFVENCYSLGIYGHMILMAILNGQIYVSIFFQEPWLKRRAKDQENRFPNEIRCFVYARKS